MSDNRGVFATCLRRVRRLFRCFGWHASENNDVKLSVEETSPHQSSVRPWYFTEDQDGEISFHQNNHSGRRRWIDFGFDRDVFVG